MNLIVILKIKKFLLSGMIKSKRAQLNFYAYLCVKIKEFFEIEEYYDCL